MSSRVRARLEVATAQADFAVNRRAEEMAVDRIR